MRSTSPARWLILLWIWMVRVRQIWPPVGILLYCFVWSSVCRRANSSRGRAGRQQSCSDAQALASGTNRKHLAWNLHFCSLRPNSISIFSMSWVTNVVYCWDKCHTDLEVTFTFILWSFRAGMTSPSWNDLIQLIVCALWGGTENRVCPLVQPACIYLSLTLAQHLSLLYVAGVWTDYLTKQHN